MQIGTNSIAQTAIHAIHAGNAAVSKAAERISTTFRVNRASDDPAGMAIGNQLKTQISSMSKATDNINQGIAMAQIVDDSFTQIANILADMASAVLDDSTTSTTMQAYLDSIDSIAANALWNGSSLMDFSGSDSTYPVSIQSGVNSGDTTDLTFHRITSSQLGLSTTSDTSDISSAISTISEYQSDIGAAINGLTYQANALSSFSTTYSSAYGNIMNADLAQETANLAAAQIQRDGATAMLTQANGMNKEIVSLLLKSVTN